MTTIVAPAVAIAPTLAKSKTERPDPSAKVIAALAERGLLGLLDDVCRLHCVTRAEVCSRNRSKSVSHARKDLWSRMRRHRFLAFSYVELGRLFVRNHTTVMLGVRSFEARQAQMLAVDDAA